MRYRALPRRGRRHSHHERPGAPLGRETGCVRCQFGKRSDDRSAEVGSALIFGAGHCGLASRFAALACSRGLATRRTPFPSHRSFLAGCECNLRFGFHRWFGFHRPPFSLNGGKLCQANRDRLRPHRATGDSTKHAIYKLATVCEQLGSPLHLLSTCLGSGSACAR